MVRKAHILQWNSQKKSSKIENDFQMYINPNCIIRNEFLEALASLELGISLSQSLSHTVTHRCFGQIVSLGDTDGF